MPAAHQDRIDRLKRLLELIPCRAHADDANYPDTSRLLIALAGILDPGCSPKARIRAIQRDLNELVQQGRIEVVASGSRPFRYRRTDVRDDHPAVLGFVLQQIQDLARDALPRKQLDRVWKKLAREEPVLDVREDRFRVLTDTLRLRPAEIRDQVLVAVIEALATRRVLHVIYRDGLGKRTRPILHPQALVQRGPRIYLFALKADEVDPVRLYALHRMIGAAVGEVLAREADGFDLDAAIRDGIADFTNGERIRLELKARGYVADLLLDCALSDDQVVEDEPEGSGFEIRIAATVPSSGQLFRWLMGCGDNVQVTAPVELSDKMLVQAKRIVSLYNT